MPRADLDKNPVEVASMFDFVAPKYDLTNTVLSFGQDKYWRKEMVEALALDPEMRVLDLAAGTGVSSDALLNRGAAVVAADFSLGMLQAAKNQQLDRVVADAYNLPFADEIFSAVTISFGFRNMADRKQVLQEINRVLVPGGKLLICEFSTPKNKWFSKIYKEYLLKWLPKIAQLVSSNPEAYKYLAETIINWPNQVELGEILKSAGWKEIKWRNLTAGIVALHIATKVA